MRMEVFAQIATFISSKRTPEQIEKCYSNIRTRAIEKDRHNFSESKKTGGGIPDLKKLEPHEEEILTFIKKAEPLVNIFEESDSTSTTLNEPTHPMPKKTKKSWKPPTEMFEQSGVNVLKANVLATQGLADAYRLPDDDDLKGDLIKFYREEIKPSLTFLKEMDI